MTRSPSSIAQVLEIATKVTVVLTFIAGALLYIYGQVWPASLEVARPDVLEFRCQTSTFDARRCFEEDEKTRNNTTLSAALRITANGPVEQSVAIESVLATVTFPWNAQGLPLSSGDEPQTIKLLAFWTGDLTGAAGQFQQAVAESVKGGSSVRREYWMMPRARELSECEDKRCTSERVDFLPWHRFVERAWRSIENNTNTPNPPRIDVKFSVSGSKDHFGRRREVVVRCALFLRKSASVALRDATRFTESGTPLWLTLPCREPAPPASA